MPDASPEQIDTPRRPQAFRGLVRIGRAVLLAAIVVASLLTFPSATPWMVAFWLLWHTLSVWRGRPGWPPLATCAAVLAVKGMDWSPALLTLMALMLALGVIRGFPIRKAWTRWGRRVVWTGIAAVWIAWLGTTLTWSGAIPRGHVATLLPERPVACLGDSLTAYGYPKCLRPLLSIPVVDLGHDGFSTGDAIKRLASLADANPQVVVIELGGHDYLRGHSRAETKKNLETIVDACQAIGAEVILMEILRGFITDPFSGLERQIARERGLLLLPDTAIRELVLWSPFAPPGMWLRPESRLSADGLHPNARGNQLLAEKVAEALAGRYGTEVLATHLPADGTMASRLAQP